MSEMYDTAIEWLEQYDLWNTLAGFNGWQIMLLVSCIALPLYIKFKKKKEPKTIKVHKYFYNGFPVLIILMTGLLAVQNASYGASIGTSTFTIVTNSMLFFCADMAFVAGCYMFLSVRPSIFLCIVGMCGLGMLTIFSGTAFFTGQSHEKDNLPMMLKIKEVENLNAQVALLAPNQFANRRDTNKAIGRLNREIVAMSEAVGGYVSSSSAISKEIGLEIGKTTGFVNLSTRLLWMVAIAVFVMGGGGVISHLRIRGNSTEKQTSSKDRVKQGTQGGDDTATGSKH